MLQRIVPPRGLVVSLMEVKTHLRLDHATEDSYLEGLIQSATEWVEQTLGRALLLQTWQKMVSPLPLDQSGLTSVGDPARIVALDYPPLIEILSINTLGPNKSKHAIRRYAVDTNSNLPRVSISEGRGVLEIIYRCGYGDRPLSVPAPLRQAILLVAAYFYENRAQETEFKSPFLQSLLTPFRIVRAL